jgi:hypothetical protein
MNWEFKHLEMPSQSTTIWCVLRHFVNHSLQVKLERIQNLLKPDLFWSHLDFFEVQLLGPGPVVVIH